MRRAAFRGVSAFFFAGALWVSAAPALAQQSETDVFVAQAILAYEDKRYDEALGYLREAVTQDPKNVEAWYYLGLVYVAKQQLPEATDALERAHKLAPHDFSVRYLLGVTYFARERYDLAQPLLEQCFKERPKTEGLGYYVGFMRYRNKQYGSAVEAFKAEVSPTPAIQQLTRFYSGLALAIMGQPEQAAAELDAATKGLTGSALTGPAERLRDSALAAAAAGSRFHAELKLGYTFDDNVKLDPLPSNDPVAQALAHRSTRSPGALASLSLSYDWLRHDGWVSTVGYQFFENYTASFPNFGVQDNVGLLGLTYSGAVQSGALAGARYAVGAQYSYDYQTLGGDQFLQRHTGTLFGTMQWNSGQGDPWWMPVNVTTPIVRLQGKEFAKLVDFPVPPQEDRSGNNYMTGFMHTFLWDAGRHYLRLGYQWDFDNTNGQDFVYWGSRLLAGVQYSLPKIDTRLSYDMDMHFTNYIYNNFLLPVQNPNSTKRRDLEQTHIFRMVQPLPWLERQEGGKTIRPLSFNFEYQALVTRSNLKVFEYDRNVLSVSLSYQY